MRRIWENILTERDKQVIKKAGYEERGAVSWGSRGVGTNPVVLIIDMQKGVVGENVPILKAMEKFPLAMGEIAWAAIEHIVSLLDEARKANVPIIHMYTIPRGFSRNEPLAQIVEPLAPKEGELVIEKSHASAFHGTPLVTHLIQLKADTIIVVGNSTSGCVRAAAVDAKEYGFSVIIPEECVFDRIEASHKASLLDLWMKYAEVMSNDRVLAYVRTKRK
jgi:nicotinamidase-related amidase